MSSSSETRSLQTVLFSKTILWLIFSQWPSSLPYSGLKAKQNHISTRLQMTSSVTLIGTGTSTTIVIPPA
uniref:Putative cnidarian restricted protein n=1 Tax=Clytia hemisphaerica TaxID=252671 RepID=A0A069DN05_9CNID